MPSPYVERLPIGQRMPFPEGGIPFWEIFPYKGELQAKVLDAPALPEPPRQGEAGAEEWGDGAAHLHLWLIARPEGMMQLRGSCLPLWDDVLPEVPVQEWARTGRLIAAAMAAGGGTAHV